MIFPPGGTISCPRHTVGEETTGLQGRDLPGCTGVGERIQKICFFTAVLINLPVDTVVTLRQQNHRGRERNHAPRHKERSRKARACNCRAQQQNHRHGGNEGHHGICLSGNLLLRKRFTGCTKMLLHPGFTHHLGLHPRQGGIEFLMRGGIHARLRHGEKRHARPLHQKVSRHEGTDYRGPGE